MKMPKLKFDKATLQEFFLLHVEKMVLGVVVVLLVLFVYWGTQLEGMKDDLKSPKQLQELADKVKVTMESKDNWERIAPERKVEYDTKTIVETSVTQDIFPGLYAGGRQFDKPIFPRHKSRTDPKVFPPKSLTVVSIVGPLALKRDQMAAAGAERPMAGQVKDDPLSDTIPTGIGASGYGGYGEHSPPVLPRREDSTDKKKTERKKMPTRPNPRNGGKPSGGYEDDFMMDHAPPPPGPGMATATTAEGPRRFERDCGFVPSADCTWITGRAVVVQAVVPWEKQFDEYRRCLEEAADFRLDRDLPNYMTYLVERADVTANPNADPKTLTWQTPLMADGRTPYTTGKAREETWYKWSGFPAEIMDADFLDFELTHPAPPFMLRDLTEVMKHPDIPVVSEEVVDPTRNAPTITYDELGRPIENTTGPGYRNPGAEAHGRQRTVFQHKMPNSGGGGPGGETRGVYNGPNGGAETIEHAEQKVRQYKLIRFTDVTVIPGKIYRYRIKVVLEDPNHPRDMTKDPPVSTLEDPVKLRIKQVADKEAQRNNRRIFWVESDWSEASPPVTLPDIEGYYASAVQPSTMQTVRPDRPPLLSKAPTGKMVEVTWDNKHCVDVPVVVTVERGSSINFQGEVQVVHPVEGTIRKIEDFNLHRPAVVAEVDGGVTIPPVSVAHGKPLVTPGEMLVFDEKGNWHMLNESRDIEGVHKHILDDSLLKDPPAADTTRPPGAGPGPGPGPGRGRNE